MLRISQELKYLQLLLAVIASMMMLQKKEDDKLLWDLNLSMDVWPCDGQNVDSQKDIVDNISMTSEALQTKPSDGGNVDFSKGCSRDLHPNREG